MFYFKYSSDNRFQLEEKWNAEGSDGLNHKKGAGRVPFLTETQMKEVDEYIKSKDSLGTNNVHYFIEKRFGIDYSLKQVRFIINKLEYGWIKLIQYFQSLLKMQKK